MHDALWQFFVAHQTDLIVKLWQQLYLVAFSMFFAVIIGVPLALWVVRITPLRVVFLNIANLMQTIPSLALFAFLLPFVGIGAKPAIVALTFYALLPIMRSTITGVEQIASQNIEASNALGLTRLQKLRLIEFPLALPVMYSGIRTATVICIGIATLATFIGAGGLGDFINQGLEMDNVRLVLLGAIPAALLALSVDTGMALYEKRLQNYRRKPVKGRWLILILGLMIFCGGYLYMRPAYAKSGTIRIASKKFTEQYILAEIMGQLIAAKTHLRVVQQKSLGTTQICLEALENDESDLYPDYTGTLYLINLHQTKMLSSEGTYQFVKAAFSKKQLAVLPGFGFNNSSGLAVRSEFAKQYHLKTISDLVPIDQQLILAATPSFLERPDCAPGLLRVYGLRFGDVKEMDDSLKYPAIMRGAVNIISVYTTDGHIRSDHLTVLRDDKHLFPPFEAVPIARAAFLTAHPKVRIALQSLHGLIDNKTMQQLNYEVEVLGETPSFVACRFLNRKQLVHTVC